MQTVTATPTRDQLVEAVRSMAAPNKNRPPGEKAFYRETRLHRNALYDVGIRTYGDLCELAGYARNILDRHADAELLLAPLADLTAQLGRFPNSRDCEFARRADRRFPSTRALATAARNAGPLTKQLLEWTSGKPQHIKVQEILEEHLKAPDRSRRTQRGIVREHVHLFRYGASGRDYKVGRTENVARRHSQLASMFPGSIRVVHVIDTDDPAGIERYWLTRFASKCLPKGGDISLEP